MNIIDTCRVCDSFSDVLEIESKSNTILSEDTWLDFIAELASVFGAVRSKNDGDDSESYYLHTADTTL